ncbi:MULTISPECIES: hypothetical protein [unclassified Rhizobium]|uniref:hypothetical protein n=1 Tax=unclassified Rhizobium TaxID=2613769 RepID=UPI0007EC225C|nr:MULTISPECIES: hypothetical protein [unclassified Rhizobium]ANL12055.1 hypothetical protein AMJ98_PA00109 [Rhizobium sp. N1341]ANM42900.1 hypothetical protein AMK03_PA00109 [Rhizobium sp. N741]
MDMTMLSNGLEVAEKLVDSFAHFMRGQPDPRREVSMECEIVQLPKLMPRFHILPGDAHPEAPSFVRDYAEIVRSMAPPCELIAGPKVMVDKRGSVPSHLHYAKGKRPGSSYLFRKPQILISTMLTPKRPPQDVTPSSGVPVDDYGRPITNLIGREQVLMRVINWIMVEADRIWPGDDELPKWSVRVWESLREDQDISMLEAELCVEEQIGNAFVTFALGYLQNSHFGRFAVMEDIAFHTREFARVVTGILGREIAEHGDQLWDDR